MKIDLLFLIVCLCILVDHPWILQDPVVPVNSNSSAVLLALISCSAVDKLRKVTLRVRKVYPILNALLV
jgi:hypothetical protein